METNKEQDHETDKYQDDNSHIENDNENEAYEYIDTEKHRDTTQVRCAYHDSYQYYELYICF